jgi:hypothetical protein
MSGSAAQPDDYTMSSNSGKVTIQAGQRDAHVTLYSHEDKGDEGKERPEGATMTLHEGAGYTLKNKSATTTITP